MLLSILILTSLCLSALSLPPRGSTYAPVVVLKNGSYYGKHSRHYNQDFFLGVPFAKPPVGDLRLRRPVSLDSSWHGLRNATQYGYACVGYGTDTRIGADDIVSEDCLTLNVVRPSGYENSKLPVGVWIFGGGFYEGSSRDQKYNLSFIVEQSVQIGKPIVGVSFNYRLSGWGFLWSQEVVKAGIANLGLYDQRMLLHWLQENIAAFGGNPKRVTIWGESAGAVSVGLQLLAYNGRNDGLFHGAIAESGPTSGVGLTNPTKSIAEATFRNITMAAGCAENHDKIACLRRLSFEEYNRILKTKAGTEDYYQVYLGPLVDGDIIAREGNTQLVDGAFVKVPYIMGTNTDEGTDFVPFGINSDNDFLNFFRGYNISERVLKKIVALYPNDPRMDVPLSHPRPFGRHIGTQFKRAATLATDLTFDAPRRLAATQWLRHVKQSDQAPLYSYRFNAIGNGIPAYFAVTHGQEVPFVFYNVHGVGYPDKEIPYYGPDPFAGKPPSYFALASLMSRMWASFIHGGDPNWGQKNAPLWTPYTEDSKKNYVFDANVTSFLEPDTYRKEGIAYLVEQFLKNKYPWSAHSQS